MIFIIVKKEGTRTNFGTSRRGEEPHFYQEIWPICQCVDNRVRLLPVGAVFRVRVNGKVKTNLRYEKVKEVSFGKELKRSCKEIQI